MGCQYFTPTPEGATSITVAMPRLTFGRGTLNEVGARCVARQLKRVALFTDPALENGPLVTTVLQSIKQAGVDVAVFSDIRIEVCDDSVHRGAQFLVGGRFDGVVSVGGGSVIDAAKGALILAQFGGVFKDYLAKPIGQGKAISSPLACHIACPTTAGTGSECTSLSVVRINELDTKFVVASPYLLPTDAIVDPQCLDSIPPMVMASTGFDLCCHALECFTARAYTHHAAVTDPATRQYVQGANPFSDLGAREAMGIVGQYLVRGVHDKDDKEARDKLMWGATLAGLAFGNSGTHLPHAMSYGVTHLMHNVSTQDYPIAAPFVPHGISVIVSAPAIFKYTAEGALERHMEGAQLLSADTKGAVIADAGEVLSKRLIQLMRDTHIPNGLSGIGFTTDHVKDLAISSIRQARAIANTPRESNLVDIENLYTNAISYW